MPEPSSSPLIHSTLRGWLTDVFVGALLSDEASPSDTLEALSRRLGPKSSIHDPIYGSCEGMPAVEERLRRLSEWLKSRGAHYERRGIVTGGDRDVTDGVLTITGSSDTQRLAIACLAEKHRAREVVVRLYLPLSPLGGRTYAQHAVLTPSASSPSLPVCVGSFVQALAKANLDGLLASFESTGWLETKVCQRHARESGALRSFFIEAGLLTGPTEWQITGTADDGRTTSVEFNLTRWGGREVTPQGGLALFKRGANGLLESVRLVEDFSLG